MESSTHGITEILGKIGITMTFRASDKTELDFDAVAYGGAAKQLGEASRNYIDNARKNLYAAAHAGDERVFDGILQGLSHYISNSTVEQGIVNAAWDYLLYFSPINPGGSREITYLKEQLDGLGDRKFRDAIILSGIVAEEDDMALTHASVG